MKLPLSVLVVVHTASLQVLLLERASRAGFWQSVTGSLDRVDEPLAAPPPVRMSPQEHTAFAWLPWREAARKCFSWSNRDAILMLGEKAL